MSVRTEQTESLGLDERKLFDDEVYDSLTDEFSEK